MSQVYDEKFIPVSDRAAEDEDSGAVVTLAFRSNLRRAYPLLPDDETVDERFAKLLAALKLVDRPGERSA
jgi:hypothetical protein